MKKIILSFFVALSFLLGNFAIGKELPRIEAVTTFAPDVPPPIKRNYSAYVIVKFETIEITKELDDGVNYQFWTYYNRIFSLGFEQFLFAYLYSQNFFQTSL